MNNMRKPQIDAIAQKYISLAQEMGAADAVLFTADQIC